MYNQLTREQRYAIYLGIQEGKSQRAIARQINVSPSTVSREIRRNSTHFGHYSWSIAQENAEFRNHRRIANALNAKVYFADPYASWQKGAIENANKLIRQYIPKGTDFNLITDDFIHSVQLKINRRPREKLNFYTPKDEFFKFLS